MTRVKLIKEKGVRSSMAMDKVYSNIANLGGIVVRDGKRLMNRERGSFKTCQKEEGKQKHQMGSRLDRRAKRRRLKFEDLG